MLNRILELPDSEFLQVIPQAIIVYRDLLLDYKEKKELPRSEEQDDDLKTLFFIFLRALSIIPPGDLPRIIPITTLCDILHVFLDSNAEVLKEYLEPKQDVYENDLERLIQSILDSIRKMEKGGGKKSASSSAINMNSLQEMISIMVHLSQIWPGSFTNYFWKISSATSSLLFIYESMTKVVIAQNDSTIRDQVQKSKKELLLIVSRLLEYKYWKSLSDTDLDYDERERILNDFCDWMLFLLDSSDMQGKAECFIDAPLLLDYEIFYGLSDSIHTILPFFHAEEKDFDTARIEYLLTSLEHIVAFSGYTERLLDERKKSSAINMGQPPSYSASMIQNSISPEDQMAFMMKISHVHELFPDLGEGFIEECLKEFENDPELVVMALLENQLPPYLQNLDRSLPSKRLLFSAQQANELALVRTTSHDSIDTAVSQTGTHVDVDTATALLQNLRVIESNNEYRNEFIQDPPLSDRRNIFDGDKFDVLSGRIIDQNLVYFGKKDKTSNFEKERAEFMDQQKAAIIAAQYQAEDDEYDDTYDASDVKLTGIFDGESLDAESKKEQFNPFEKQLVEMFKKDPAFFHSFNRKSKQRQDFCNKLKWTNEQVEGWFIMFNRNPKKDEILEKYDKPDNRLIDTRGEGGPTKSDSSPGSSPNLHNISRYHGRGGRGGGRVKKRGQRIYKPPPE